MMNKSIIFTVLLVVMFSVNSFAKTNEDSPGSSFEVDETQKLRFSFSPKVAGKYLAEGATPTNEQWYSIGTYHGGGTLFYGTASDQTTVFKKKRSTNDGFDVASLPDAPDPVENEDGTVTYEPWVTYETDTEGNLVQVTDDWYR
jgi:hypothetical protein